MSASEVGFLAQQVVEFDAEVDAVTTVDLTDISEENRSVLHICVAEYRSAGRRVVTELLRSEEHTSELQSRL